MNCEVITVANRWPEADYYCHREFLLSLTGFDIQPTILGMDEPWGGLMTKPRKLKKYLESECNADVIISVDAFDLVFASHPDEIVGRWLASGGKWTAGAERNCFPDGSLAEKHPPASSSYKYLNSGFIISKPEDMLKVLKSMNLDSIPDDGVDQTNPHPNDQDYYMREFLKQPVPMELDTQTQLVWNLCGVDESNFDFSYEIPMNRETGFSPGVFHWNGGKDVALMNKILTHLKLR